MKPGFARSLLPPLAAALGALLAAPLGAVSPEDLALRISRGEPVLVIDVRPAAAYAQGHVPGAVNIPPGLLPHKRLPASLPVVICSDGLGAVSEQAALAALRGRQGGMPVEVLAGGYAAWLARTRLATEPAGVSRERIPGITYRQLLAADRGGMVLVDLRRGAAPPRGASVSAPSGASVPGRERATAAAEAPDPVAGFASRLGVPLVRAEGGRALEAAKGAGRAARAEPPSGPQAASGGDQADPLLVLVADSEEDATRTARELRARGHYRFTLLIGGEQTILHEGRTGTGRTDGDLPAVRNHP